MSVILAGVFLGAMLVALLTGVVSPMVFALYGLASLATFIAYALDKSAALRNQWRTRESTLHLFSLAGGWPGALIAQQVLCHKSSKQPFKTVFWTTVVANCCMLAVYLMPDAAGALLSIAG